MDLGRYVMQDSRLVGCLADGGRKLAFRSTLSIRGRVAGFGVTCTCTWQKLAAVGVCLGLIR
jgi:hypothetical protein